MDACMQSASCIEHVVLPIRAVLIGVHTVIYTLTGRALF
jgi:hypothetical protein